LLSFLLYLIYIAQFILFAHAFQAMSFVTSLASTNSLAITIVAKEALDNLCTNY